MQFSFQKIFYGLATIIALVTVLSVAKTFLVPLAFALLLAFILLPVCERFERWGVNRLVAAVLAQILLLISISGVVFFFSTQIMQFSLAFADFKEKIMEVFTDLILFANQNLPFKEDLNRETLLLQFKEFMRDSAGSLAGKTFSGTASFLTGLLAVVIYSFLFLIYRSGFVDAFVLISRAENQRKVREMLRHVQRVGQKYLSGMSVLVLIIGCANSLGLLLIGIDNPFLFGFLGSALSIIPFVGTIFGAVIPVLYAFMTTDQLWIPLAVVLLFWLVQLISDNLLNPVIVGNSLNVNAMAAIISLLAGAALWGVAGMILFLPYAAMLKVICEEFVELRPLALLIGNQNTPTEESGPVTPGWWKKTLVKWGF